MTGDTHTEARLADEMAALRRRVSELEGSAAQRKEADEALSASEEAAQRLAKESAVLAEEVGKLIPINRIAISVIGAEHDTFTNEYVVGPEASGRAPGGVVTLPGTLVELAGPADAARPGRRAASAACL